MRATLAIGLVLLGAVAGAEPTKCRRGMSSSPDTAGHCCWEGQVWKDGRCIGQPTSCPDGMNADESGCKAQPCTPGKERAKDGEHCCYPGQGWSMARQVCVGLPTKCPDGLVATNCDHDALDASGNCAEGCAMSRAGRFEGERQELAECDEALPATDSGWTAKGAWAARRGLCVMAKGVLAKELLKDTHPSGTNPRVARSEVLSDGNHVVATIVFQWKGGVLGGLHSTTIRWEFTEAGHGTARVIADNAPVGVDPEHARALDVFFRTRVYPMVPMLVKNPKAF